MREGLRSSSRVAKLEYDKETEEDNANSGRKKGDGTTFKSDEGKKMIDLISADLDFFRDSLVSLSERKIEGGSELVERQEDVDINADASADTERIRIGGRRRERKRKGVESSYDEIDEVDSGIKKGKETTSVIDKEKQGLFPDLTALEFSSIERKMKGQKNGSDNSEQLECNEEANVNTHDESHTDRAKSGRGRRGRKRRMVESSVFDREDAAQKKKVKEAFLDGKTEFVGRILRSRTMERNGGDKVVDGGLTQGVAGANRKKRSDASNKRIIEMGKNGGAKLIRGKKKVKGSRGRPPKVERSGGNKVVDGGLTQGIAGTKRKKESDASNKRKKESDASNKRIIEMGKNGGAPLIRGKKKVKGRRGRPPKVPGKCGPSFKVIGCEKKVARGSKFVNKGKDCRLASYSCQSGEKIVVKPLKRYKHKEGRQKGIHRRAEMQLLKEQIVTMLKSAGWTIEYRPRLSKEYSDAVYISPQGTGCRSVTSAYRVIKQEVEEGNADSRAVSAFTSIPEEELSKLYRVRKKNLILMDGANKTNDAAPQKKPLKRKHSTENTGHLRHKHKEKQGPCARSPTRSIKHMPSKSDLDGSTNTFETGLHRSNRGRHNSKRYALLVRESKKGLNPDTEVFALCGGKRSLLSWMIDLGTVPVSQKVQFMNRRRTRVLLEGRIARYGILCDCCNKTLSVSDFEYHAGSKLNQPFQNIYLESGSSLLQCLLDSWSSHEGSECIGFQTIDADGDDPNDDTCNVCGDGGDLICCDGCPSTFHQNCLNIQKFPSGDWHCVYCCCKFCGMVSGSSRQRDQDSGIPGSALLTCCLCEKKYHQLCVQGKDAVHVDLKCPSFCGKKCREVSERLHVLLGVKHQLKEGFSWTFIQRSDVSQYKSLSSVSQEVECNSKLAVALSVLDECFLPIVDRRSGINMIRNVVYSCGSNFSRLNYSGFFTAILERDDEIISVASIRIHGNQLAEMPFIGTRHIYRRQGMCRRLLNAIETALRSINVENLVIPAISELLKTWTSVFGFKPLEESIKKEMKYMNMMAFHGVDMLQKPLLELQLTEGNFISTAAMKSTEPETDHQTTHKGASDSARGCSVGPDSNASRVVFNHVHGTDDKVAAADCVLQLPDLFSNGGFDVTNKTVNFQESVTNGSCLSHLGVSQGNRESGNEKVDSVSSVKIALELDGHCNIKEINKQVNVHSESMNLLSTCEAERKSCSVSQIGSDATNCGKNASCIVL